MTIQLLEPRRYGQYVIPAGSVVSVFDAATESGLIASKSAISSAAAVTWTVPSEIDGQAFPLDADYTIKASDDGRRFYATKAITVTVPLLDPQPEFTVQTPASGTLTLHPIGGVTFNGAASDVTRTRASNQVGSVVVTPYAGEGNAYGVSGA